MTTARYAIVFSVTATVVSFISIRLLHPVSEAIGATGALAFVAGAFAAAFTWAVGLVKGRDLGAFEGVVITLATFGATIATVVVLGRPNSFAQFVDNVAALSFWALLLQGWYVLPIGAALPWVARKLFSLAPSARVS